MKELPLSGLEVFVTIAEHGSLRQAAKVLGVQPPAISYRLKALEERIGTPLFVRTTRSVSLTDAGKSLLVRARPALDELGGALEDARSAGTALKGTLRLTLPLVAYELTIAKRLPAFHAAYPDIELELSFSEAFVDIVAGGFHAGIRLGDHLRDDMIAMRLGPPIKEVVFGTPAYFERHGRPRQPADLLRHNCVRYRYIASGRYAEWQFLGSEGVTGIDVKGSLTVNSTAALVRAVRDGVGIGWLFRPCVEDDLQSGWLESVLSDYAIERPGYFLYYPRANAGIQALRVFIDFMRV